MNGQDSASMKMNVKKCKTVHFGKQKNLKIDYFMIDISGSKSTLGSSTLERGLCVMVREDLKWDGHIINIVYTINRLLGLLKRTFICRDLPLWRHFNASLVKHTNHHLDTLLSASSSSMESVFRRKYRRN